MATTEVSINIREHGIIINEHKKRVKCKYCSKEVTGFSRLKQHLGGVRGDVVPCEEVPEDVKIQLGNSLLERKNNMLKREVLQLFHSDIPWKANTASNSSMLNCIQHESIQPSVTMKRKHIVMNSVLEEGTAENNLSSPKKVSDSRNTADNVKAEEDSSRRVKRYMARFLFENGIDFDAAKSWTFQKMVDAMFECGFTGFEIPSSNELSGIFQDEMKDIHHYLKEVRQSWRNTGCSILLDGWTDEKGRSLINFVVDCPKGPIFLKCADISGSLGNVNTMMSLLDGVIDDVGVENVVQVITYTTSGCMVSVGKQLVEKYRTIFWNVCASHCINLMLEKIGKMSSIEEVVSKAKTITEFVYSDETLLRLVRKHTQGRDLIIQSKIKSTMPFLTLEKIVFENENMKILFGSSAWKTSKWARTTSGRRVANLVEDPSFWTDARMVLKATIPLVSSLFLINGEDRKPQLPYIYETMDQVKETIKEEFKNKKVKYLPFWQIIDGIWDNILHSPLHSAGYFLNPTLFYSSDFFTDAEVASGLLCCLVRMVEDQKIQNLISLQIEEYREGKGAFAEKMAVDQRTKVPPETWWSLYGGQYPELQRFAIRILCQTCSGASRYDLKKSLSEQLRTKGNNSVEQHKLNDQIFVQHNMHLQHSLCANGSDADIVLEQINQMGDRVVEEEQVLPSGRGGSVWTDSDEAIIHRGVASSFEPKDEPV